jgi:hypothetical protein
MNKDDIKMAIEIPLVFGTAIGISLVVAYLLKQLANFLF